MMSLLRVFVDIMFWRKGPQDLPASALLLALTALVYAVLIFTFHHLLMVRQDEHIVQRILLDSCVGLAGIWLLLRLFGRQARFLQTALALIGAGALMEPALAVLQAVLLKLGQTHPLALPLMFVLVAMVIWYLLISAHILRAALEIGLFFAAALVLLYVVGTYLISVRLLPPVVAG